MDRPSRRAALEYQAASFPANPGVYLFKDAKGRVLYVGKADLLRDRVRAYFGPSLDVRHVRMVERAERLEYVLTDSVSEAFLLEANLIKQHHPRYNIRLKDDKSYPYVKVTLDEDFPRVLRTRALGDRTARYFGPFANAPRACAIAWWPSSGRSTDRRYMRTRATTSTSSPPRSMKGMRSCRSFASATARS